MTVIDGKVAVDLAISIHTSNVGSDKVIEAIPLDSGISIHTSNVGRVFLQHRKEGGG